jgi:hypothetical protein
VVIAPDGTATVVYDGNDLRTPLIEGERVGVDSLVLTPTGRLFVSLCCEPVPGSFNEVIDGQLVGDVRYDHALALSPDGTRIAGLGADTVDIRPLDGNAVVSAGGVFEDHRFATDVGWIGPDRIAVIEHVGDGGDSPSARLIVLDADLTGWTDPSAVVLRVGLEAGVDGDGVTPWLAGLSADGSILVFDTLVDDSVLVAYDPVTLERRPAQDVALPGPAESAWNSPAGPVWLDRDGGLHVGEATVPGTYVWARPVGQ